MANGLRNPELLLICKPWLCQVKGKHGDLGYRVGKCRELLGKYVLLQFSFIISGIELGFLGAEGLRDQCFGPKLSGQEVCTFLRGT
jgi:hypothetical protein